MDNTLTYYNQNADQFVQGTLSVDFKQTQDRFLEKLPVGVCILDFGCGSGRDTKYFLKKGNVRKLWEGVLKLSEVRDVFTGETVVPKHYDVDHFIPWSFVMNDELWNLMPMDSSLNSSKSNRLPKWEPFFTRFAANQYLLYGFIHEKVGIYKLFEACYRDNFALNMGFTGVIQKRKFTGRVLQYSAEEYATDI